MFGRGRVLLYTLPAVTSQRARPVRPVSSILTSFRLVMCPRLRFLNRARWRGFHRIPQQVPTKPQKIQLSEIEGKKYLINVNVAGKDKKLVEALEFGGLYDSLVAALKPLMRLA